MHKGFCKYRRTFWGSRRKTEMKNCEAEMLHFALSWPLEGVLAPPEAQPAQSQEELVVTPPKNVKSVFCFEDC